MEGKHSRVTLSLMWDIAIGTWWANLRLPCLCQECCAAVVIFYIHSLLDVALTLYYNHIHITPVQMWASSPNRQINESEVELGSSSGVGQQGTTTILFVLFALHF